MAEWSPLIVEVRSLNPNIFKWPLLVYFRPFHKTIQILVEKSKAYVDVELGIRTQGRRMEGTDGFTELGRPSKNPPNT